MLELYPWFWAGWFVCAYWLLEIGAHAFAGENQQPTIRVEIAIYSIAVAAVGFLIGSVGL